MQNITLNIGGMTCRGCVSSVQRALSTTEGVAEVTLDFEAGTAQISFDETKTAPQALVAVVEDAGFDATL